MIDIYCRCKAADEPVVWKREQERLCTLCGCALHTSRNCPSKVYSEETSMGTAAGVRPVSGLYLEDSLPKCCCKCRSSYGLLGALMCSSHRAGLVEQPETWLILVHFVSFQRLAYSYENGCSLRGRYSSPSRYLFARNH